MLRLPLGLCLIVAGSVSCSTAEDAAIDPRPDSGGQVPAPDTADASEPWRPDPAADGGSDGGSDSGPSVGGPFSPSNREAVGSLRFTGLVLGPPSGQFHTADQCTDDSPLGHCAVVARADLPDLCVCRMDRVTIADLTVIGPNGLVILAWESATLTGTLSVGGRADQDGPGAGPRYLSAASGIDGGAGGSHAAPGGNDGAAAYAVPALEPLVGGMTGQDGCGGRAGGGGGGAVQISAGAQIEVTGTILAGGAGGEGGFTAAGCTGGAGGGAGGAILLEAPAVSATGVVAANGGGGGGGGGDYGVGQAGADSGEVARAAGGQGEDGHGCALNGYTSGGDGGGGSQASEPGRNGQTADSVSGCLGGTTYVGEGGGGGGAGRIRVNTSGGCVCSGLFSPAPSLGPLAPSSP